jgi:hypothetical protein
MMTASNIHYERAGRARGLSAGGIGALLLLARKIELDKQRFPARGFPLEKTLFLISHFANPSRIMLA